MITLHQLLKVAVKQEASDLHIVTGTSPTLRVNGQIVRVKTKDLVADDTKRICYSILTDYQKAEFEENRELDFSFGIKNMARFRANLFFQRGAVSGVFRRVALEIPNFDTLGLPSMAKNLVNYNSGLVLVTGPTGCGKTSTIAAFLDKINSTRREHIITVEDPIEFVHPHKKCIINQREIGVDTESFDIALRQLLRQDPDICLLGELRDRETIEAGLKLAETGHLVFATLHTNSAIQSISRMIGVFPADHQDRVRLQLSSVLNAVLSQRLVPRKGGGRVLATELMGMTTNIKSLIRENKLHQIYGMMQIGQEKTGMVTMNQSLLSLVLKRKIEMKQAFLFSSDKDELNKMFKDAGL